MRSTRSLESERLVPSEARSSKLEVSHVVPPLGECAEAWAEAGRSGTRVVRDPRA